MLARALAFALTFACAARADAQPRQASVGATPGQPFVPASIAPPPDAYAQPNAWTTMPESLEWDEGEPVPPGYRPGTAMRRDLVLGGAITFGVAYVAAGAWAGAMLDLGRAEAGVGLIPIAGPFVALGTARPSTSGAVALVVDGLAQATGAALITIGLVMRRPLLLRNDLGAPAIVPVPMAFGNGGAGLGFVGTM